MNPHDLRQWHLQVKKLRNRKASRRKNMLGETVSSRAGHASFPNLGFAVQNPLHYSLIQNLSQFSSSCFYDFLNPTQRQIQKHIRKLLLESESLCPPHSCIEALITKAMVFGGRGVFERC